MPLLRESYLVFGGEVIHDDNTAAKLKEDLAGGVRRPTHSPHAGHRGWARIMVLDGGDEAHDRPPVFEGAFSVDGVVHHVLTAENYDRSKYAGDPEPIEDSEMVIFRDSDIMSRLEAEVARTGRPIKDLAQMPRPQTCAHDRLGYNVDKSNPVLKFGASIDPNRNMKWYDPLGVISPDESSAYNHSLGKRQGDIGGGGNASSKYVTIPFA